MLYMIETGSFFFGIFFCIQFIVKLVHEKNQNSKQMHESGAKR